MRVLRTDHMTIARLCAQGVLRRLDQRGRFDPVEAIPAYINYKVNAIKTQLTTAGAARGRLADAKASIAEMEMAQLKASLIPADAAFAAYREAAEIAKTRLNTIPSRCAPRLATVKNAVEAQAVIADEIEQALTELSNLPKVGTKDGEDGSRADGASEAEEDDAEEEAEEDEEDGAAAA